MRSTKSSVPPTTSASVAEGQSAPIEETPPRLTKPPATPNKIDLLSFKEALDLSEEFGKRHLMLGNGFSIALRPDIFTYNTLFESAKESEKLSAAMEEVFKKLGTTDFEKVMEALEDAATLVSLYEGSDPQLSVTLKQDATQLRDVLAETIAANHPARPYDISKIQYASCKRFLSQFDGNIYTLNYDLLLYWTLMQSEVEPHVESDDGFRNSEHAVEEYVVWDVQNTDDQCIFYLHGALHIYDAGAELLKFTWSKTEIALVDQIKRSLAKRQYPLIVTEGSSEQKKARLQHSSFLSRGERSFAKIQGCLFIYGHSLAENDEHLLKLIDKGKTKHVFVGIYGDTTTEGNQRIIERARLISARRSKSGTEIHFFDAKSAHVWDDDGFDS